MERTMSTSQPFYATVPESGTITLPPEFRGAEVTIIETVPKKTAPMNDDDFKSLDEIDAEQGGPKICMNSGDYFGYMSELWNSKEEMEQFLHRRKEEQ